MNISVGEDGVVWLGAAKEEGEEQYGEEAEHGGGGSLGVW